MSTDNNAVRAWFGWRARHLNDDAGFTSFTDQLNKTFVPATWLVMRNYGLRAYVPTLFVKDKPPQVPDEIALLLYESVASYDGHKATVAGRSYGVMHRALFEFDPGPRCSRSDWAKEQSTSTKLRAFRRARPAGGGLGFDSSDAVAIVTVLTCPPQQTVAADAVWKVLPYPDCDAVAACEPGITVVWLAAPRGTRASDVSTPLAAALGPDVVVFSAHEAAPACLRFTNPDQVYPDPNAPAVKLDPDASLRIVC